MLVRQHYIIPVRSAEARDLEHKLFKREKRPIHAIVEDRFVTCANRQPKETVTAFFKRLRSLALMKILIARLQRLKRLSKETENRNAALICDTESSCVPARHKRSVEINEGQLPAKCLKMV